MGRLRGLCPSPFDRVGQIPDPPDQSGLFAGVCEIGNAGLDQFGFPHTGDGPKFPPDIEGFFQSVQIIAGENRGLHRFLIDEVVDGDNQIALLPGALSSLLSVYMIPHLGEKVKGFLKIF